jgi:arylformamidase
VEIIASIGKKRYAVNMQKPLDISISVRFDGTSLSAFGANPAQREPYQTQGFTGDVARGGSCNCDMLTFSPHLHGTHTECVGHITDTPFNVGDIVKDTFIPATLITVAPRQGRHDSNTYNPKLRPTDTVITKDQIVRGLLGWDNNFAEALIIRTRPNDPSKASRNYAKELPPFFSQEAIHYLISFPIKHLLVDIPSIDRLDDEGKLTNHHIFWNVEQGSHAVTTPSPKTVTELIYVPDTIPDGSYMLNLQLAPFVSDAAPSRPVLYEVKPV